MAENYSIRESGHPVSTAVLLDPTYTNNQLSYDVGGSFLRYLLREDGVRSR
jgi:hypothetical protein